MAKPNKRSPVNHVVHVRSHDVLPGYTASCQSCKWAYSLIQEKSFVLHEARLHVGLRGEILVYDRNKVTERLSYGKSDPE